MSLAGGASVHEVLLEQVQVVLDVCQGSCLLPLERGVMDLMAARSPSTTYAVVASVSVHCTALKADQLARIG